MSLTKAEVITRFLRAYPDASDQASGYFDSAYRRIHFDCPDIALDTKTVSLTSGTFRYSLPAELVQAKQVVYQTGVDDNGNPEGTVLIPTTFSEMTRNNTDATTNLALGTPSQYWIEAVEGTASGSVPDADWKICVYPVPNETTTDGYPILSIRGTWHAALSNTSHMIDH